MSLRYNDAVLTTKEATKYLRISKATYLKYIRLGRIKAVKAGRGWKVHKSTLRRFLDGNEQELGNKEEDFPVNPGKGDGYKF